MGFLLSTSVCLLLSFFSSCLGSHGSETLRVQPLTLLEDVISQRIPFYLALLVRKQWSALDKFTLTCTAGEMKAGIISEFWESDKRRIRSKII